MLGAIAGDIIGQPWESFRRRWRDVHAEGPLFLERAHFTDDSVLTVAVAAHHLGDAPDFEAAYRDAWRRYPRAGYGGMFRAWCAGTFEGEYKSYGNGSGMRVSPVAWVYDTLDEVMEGARLSALPTHGHPEGIKGAQAIAGAIFLARTGHDKREIAQLARALGYTLEVDLAKIQSREWFATCQATVPAALVAFLDGEGFEDVMHRCLAYNGDSDTIAAMAGPIVEALEGGLEGEILEETLARLDAYNRGIAARFVGRFMGAIYPEGI